MSAVEVHWSVATAVPPMTDLRLLQAAKEDDKFTGSRRPEMGPQQRGRAV